MAEFYIEKTEQSNGEHLVHFANCKTLAAKPDTIYLGSIASFQSAWAEGKRLYNGVNACPECASQYVQ